MGELSMYDGLLFTGAKVTKNPRFYRVIDINHDKEGTKLTLYDIYSGAIFIMSADDVIVDTARSDTKEVRRRDLQNDGE